MRPATRWTLASTQRSSGRCAQSPGVPLRSRTQDRRAEPPGCSRWSPAPLPDARARSQIPPIQNGATGPETKRTVPDLACGSADLGDAGGGAPGTVSSQDPAVEAFGEGEAQTVGQGESLAWFPATGGPCGGGGHGLDFDVAAQEQTPDQVPTTTRSKHLLRHLRPVDGTASGIIGERGLNHGGTSLTLNEGENRRSAEHDAQRASSLAASRRRSATRSLTRSSPSSSLRTARLQLLAGQQHQSVGSLQKNKRRSRRHPGTPTHTRRQDNPPSVSHYNRICPTHR